MCKERYINQFTEKFREAEIQAYDENERMAYEQSLKAYRDYINTISSAEYMGEKRGIEKGIEKGRAEGREEGRAELQHEIAAKMKANGTPAEQIAAYTDLSLEEISKL